MQDSTERLIKPTLFSSGCDVTLGKFIPYIQPFEALSVGLPCYNPHRKNIVTCKDPGIEQFLAEVEGLDFNVQLSSSFQKLPLYIPMVDLAASKLANLPDSITHIGITLTDIIKTGFSYKAGTIQESKNITFNKAVLTKCLLKKKVILFLTGPDTIIEGIWYKRNVIKLFAILKQLNFFAVTGINFSVFGSECSFSQILNLKRSLYSAYLLEKNGVPSLPHVYALDECQIDRWINWFRKNPLVNCFTINCQVQKSDEDISVIVRAVTKLLFNFPSLHVILQGFHTDKIEFLRAFIGRIHFADKVPIKCANGRRALNLNAKNCTIRTIVSKTINKNSLIHSNIEFRKKYLEELVYKIT